MKKKENQRISLTKRLLKENLLLLLSEKDLQKITVSELCAAAEINRCTFYKHYGCIADVLSDIEKGVVEDLEEIWKKYESIEKWPLNNCVEASCLYLQEHYELAKLLLRTSDSNLGFAAVILNTEHTYSMYEQNFSQIKDETIRRFVISFVIHGTYHMIREWILDGCPKTPKEMGELACQIATKGWKNAFGAKG